MTIRGQAPTEPFATSSNDESRALAYDVSTSEVPRYRVRASLPRSNGEAAVIAPIRHKLRAIASESGPGKGFNAANLLRPLVAQAHDSLRERFEAGGSAEDYLCDRAKLADSAVVGLLHIASISSGMRDRSMVAPLAAIAVGGYGRKELAPGSDLDLLFLLPESSRACPGRIAPATKACISAVVASLWDLGFELDHAVRSASECLELARDDATVLAGLVDRRLLWGGFGLFTSLDTDITLLLSGPDAGRWRDAIGDALSGTHRHARREMQGLEDEPDLKRGPGGLRDLQRAIWAKYACIGESHVAASVASRSAPLFVACAVSSPFPRGSRRRPSSLVAPTRHCTPARFGRATQTPCACPVGAFSLSRPQRSRCDRRCAAFDANAPESEILPSGCRPRRLYFDVKPFPR